VDRYDIDAVIPGFSLKFKIELVAGTILKKGTNRCCIEILVSISELEVGEFGLAHGTRVPSQQFLISSLIVGSGIGVINVTSITPDLDVF